MTGSMLSYPLRWQLLYRASQPAYVCPEVERDRIIRMFPGLDPTEAVRRLEEVRAARESKNFLRMQQIIADLIEEDQNHQSDES